MTLIANSESECVEMKDMENARDTSETQGMIHEVLGSKLELIGQTEVKGFEECSSVSNEAIADHIREVIPVKHLDSCPSVEYDPDHEVFGEDPFTLAFIYTENREIRVGGEDRFIESNEIIETVTHEIGHNAHYNLLENNNEAALRWQELNNDSSFRSMLGLFLPESIIGNATQWSGFVSDYAQTNVYEDFAESYRVYVHDPELLKIINPDKYDFMRDYVFGGREYDNQPILADY